MSRRRMQWLCLFGSLAVAALPGGRALAGSTFQYTFDRPNAEYWVSPGGAVSVSVFLTETYSGTSLLAGEGGLLTAGLRLSYAASSPAARTIEIANSAADTNPYGTGAAGDASHFDGGSTFYDAATISAHDPTLSNPIAGILELRSPFDATGAGGVASDANKGPNTYSILLGTFTFMAPSPAMAYTQVQQNLISVADLYPNDAPTNSNTVTWTSGSPLDLPGGPGIAVSPDVSISVVPEPPTGVMLGGLALMSTTLAGVYRWRKRSRPGKTAPADPPPTAEAPPVDYWPSN